jgi:hypothetical protein
MTSYLGCCSILLLALVKLADTAFAGNLSISSTDAIVSVEANDISSSEVLARLADDYDFTVERIGIASARAPMLQQFSGDLTAVITTVLSNESHVIVYSPSATHGIEKVVVYGANCQVTSGATPPQSSSPKLQVQPEQVSRSQPRPQTRSSVLALSPRPLAKEIIAPHPVATR